MKKILGILLLLFSVCIYPIYVDAMVEPTDIFYVNDYANILSEETEMYILNQSVKLNNVDGTQIVVVTVPNLEGDTIENYASRLFNQFGIGDKNKNNGLLLLLALEEREFRVEVGDGLEGILPDGKTGRFQDEYMIPYLKNNEWDKGIRNGYDAFYKEIVTLNNLDIDYSNPSIVGSSSSGIPVEPIYIIIPITLGIVVGMIVLFHPAILMVGWFILIVVFGTLMQENFIDVEFGVKILVSYFFFMFGYVLCLGIRNPSYGRGHSHGSSSRRSSFGGGHSGGGHFGGGGHSSGGGSSRHF